MDLSADAFLKDVLETATRRFIATVLNEFETYTGEKDKRISGIVKEDANRCKRVIYTHITGTEVEPARPER